MLSRTPSPSHEIPQSLSSCVTTTSDWSASGGCHNGYARARGFAASDDARVKSVINDADAAAAAAAQQSKYHRPVRNHA